MIDRGARPGIGPEKKPETTPDAIDEGRLFEELCELDAETRERCLHEIESTNPALAARLRRLLAIDVAYGAHTARSVLPIEPPDPVADISDIGAFRLVRLLGRGGMGVVYLAERRNDFEQQVAIKIMPRFAADTSGRERFAQERRILAQLRHPNICSILDGGELADGTPWLAMEYVAGEPLCAWCERRRSNVRERVALFLQLCDAVQYTHRNLVIHRDLKDNNVLVDESGRVRLLDFGIAKSLSPVAGGSQTAAHDRFFSPMTAAPEQVRGERVTVGADVYALGALLHQLLCGFLPFERPSLAPLELQRAILEDVPPKMSDTLARDIDAGATPAERAREVPPRALRGELDAIVGHCLRKDPPERYDEIGDLARDLRAWLSGHPISIARSDHLYRFGKFLRRHRIAATFAAVTVVSILGELTVTLYQASELRAQRDAAEAARLRSELDRDRAHAVAGFMRDTFETADPGRAPAAGLPARELIDRGARRLDALSGQKDIQADLALLLAESYANMGLVRESDAIYREHATTIDLLSTTDPKVRWRALTLRFSNRVAMERDGPQLDADLAVLQRLADTPEAHVQTARLHERLLARRSQFDAAAQTLELAWRRYGTKLPPPTALRLRVDLGYALLSADRFDDARRLCASIDRKALADDEPALQIRALRLIVRELGTRENEREALVLAIDDWMRTAQALYGPDSVEAASAYVFRVGVIEDAREQDALMDRAYAIQRAKLSPVSSARAYAEFNMAAFYRDLRGRTDLAEPHLASAVEIGREVSSRAHADVLKFELAWAEALNALGRHRVCLERLTDPPDVPEDPEYAKSLSLLRLELAEAAVALGRPAAVHAERAAIEALWRRLGKEPPAEVVAGLRRLGAAPGG